MSPSAWGLQRGDCLSGIPYSQLPYSAMAIAWVVVHRHPSTGSGEGTEFTES